MTNCHNKSNRKTIKTSRNPIDLAKPEWPRKSKWGPRMSSNLRHHQESQGSKIPRGLAMSAPDFARAWAHEYHIRQASVLHEIKPNCNSYPWTWRWHDLSAEDIIIFNKNPTKIRPWTVTNGYPELQKSQARKLCFDPKNDEDASKLFQIFE